MSKMSLCLKFCSGSGIILDTEYYYLYLKSHRKVLLTYLKYHVNELNPHQAYLGVEKYCLSGTFTSECERMQGSPSELY